MDGGNYADSCNRFKMENAPCARPAHRTQTPYYNPPKAGNEDDNGKKKLASCLERRDTPVRHLEQM
jgi:hypothetical protein